MAAQGFPGTDFWRKLLASTEKYGKGREFSKDCWDKAAPSYDDLENEPDYAKQVDSVIKKMAQKGALNSAYTLLDVACGTGTYALLMAPYLKKVTGLDISPGMLKRFGEKLQGSSIKNCEVIEMDWRRFPKDQQFDVVFSSMNPLLGYYKNIDKMLYMARRYLVLIGWAGWRKNLFLDKLAHMIFGHGVKGPKSDITIVFGYLYSMGYSPEMEYFHGVWTRTYSLEKQLDRIIWRLEFERRLTSREKGLVKEELKKIANGDTVTLKTQIRTGMLFLDVKNRVEVQEL